MVTIMLHCSDSSYGNAGLITKWHTFPKEKVVQKSKVYQGNGWNNIGYHYVILNGWLDGKHYNKWFDGHIETGRPINDDNIVSPDEIGAHVAGHNKGSIGICLIGKSGEFTAKQHKAALKLVFLLDNQFQEIDIKQHSDFDKKKPYCAGLDLEAFKKKYNKYKETHKKITLV